jgi:hypothetical protein
MANTSPSFITAQCQCLTWGVALPVEMLPSLPGNLTLLNFRPVRTNTCGYCGNRRLPPGGLLAFELLLVPFTGSQTDARMSESGKPQDLCPKPLLVQSQPRIQLLFPRPQPLRPSNRWPQTGGVASGR